MLKQIRGSNLVDAVRQVAAGQSLLDPSVTDRVLRRIREGKQEDARLASLNTQERKILVLIAEGLTNRQIGERLFLAEKTVKNNVSSLLAKLGMQRRTQAAVYGANLQNATVQRTARQPPTVGLRLRCRIADGDSAGGVVRVPRPSSGCRAGATPSGWPG